jgi:hypothetical protein
MDSAKPSRPLVADRGVIRSHLILGHSAPKASGGRPGVTQSTPWTCGSSFQREKDEGKQEKGKRE